MKLNIVLFLFILLSIENKIKNGVFNIVSNDLYLYYSRRKIYVSNNIYVTSFFRVIKINGNFKNTLYQIEDIETKKKLTVANNKDLIFVQQKNEINNYLFWNFKRLENNSYLIENIQHCFLIISNLNISCEKVNAHEATKFNFIKIYNEVKANLKLINSSILKNEPIDILIKYIDLRDPNLNRNGIHQISKDYDNEELRYSLRSVLNNMSWIRKIFILMPNEKVRFLKDYNLIKEKIVYIKDKDFLGYDSSNYNAFLFRYWKMKKFGISDNIIVMDDDCFINKKLEKSDFFYVNNRKVIPAIITSNFQRINKINVQENCDIYAKRVKNSREEQGRDDFFYTKFLTYSFILNLFNISETENIFIPKFTHNAIPVNLNDVKEIYDLIYHSQYRFNTLDCLYRISGYIQFQIFILSYTFLKYNRKVNNIPNNFIQLNNSITANYRTSLFCINKGPGTFNFLNFFKSKLTMEYLFPIPSKYEIVDYSIINISFNITYTMDKEIKNYENQIKIFKKQFNFNSLLFLNILIFLKLNSNNIYYYFYKDL